MSIIISIVEKKKSVQQLQTELIHNLPV